MDAARINDIHRRVSRAICTPAETDRFSLPAEVRPLVQAMLSELQSRAGHTIVHGVEVRGEHIYVRAILPGPLRERALAEGIIADYEDVPARLAMEIAEVWRDR